MTGVIKPQNNHPILSPGYVVHHTPCGGSCLIPGIQYDTPKISHHLLGDTDLENHAISHDVRGYHFIIMEASNMEADKVQRPGEDVARRSRQHSPSAPVTAATGARGSIACFLRKATRVCPPAANVYLADHQQQASASVCHQGSPTAEPIDKPGICWQQTRTSATRPLLLAPLAAYLSRECGTKAPTIRYKLPHHIFITPLYTCGRQNSFATTRCRYYTH